MTPEVGGLPFDESDFFDVQFVIIVLDKIVEERAFFALDLLDVARRQCGDFSRECLRKPFVFNRYRKELRELRLVFRYIFLVRERVTAFSFADGDVGLRL
jgi:hypothetical protein